MSFASSFAIRRRALRVRRDAIAHRCPPRRTCCPSRQVAPALSGSVPELRASDQLAGHGGMAGVAGVVTCCSHCSQSADKRLTACVGRGSADGDGAGVTVCTDGPALVSSTRCVIVRGNIRAIRAMTTAAARTQTATTRLELNSTLNEQ